MHRRPLEGRYLVFPVGFESVLLLLCSMRFYSLAERHVHVGYDEI